MPASWILVGVALSGVPQNPQTYGFTIDHWANKHAIIHYDSQQSCDKTSIDESIAYRNEHLNDAYSANFYCLPLNENEQITSCRQIADKIDEYAATLAAKPQDPEGKFLDRLAHAHGNTLNDFNDLRANEGEASAAYQDANLLRRYCNDEKIP